MSNKALKFTDKVEVEEKVETMTDKEIDELASHLEENKPEEVIKMEEAIANGSISDEILEGLGEITLDENGDPITIPTAILDAEELEGNSLLDITMSEEDKKKVFDEAIITSAKDSDLSDDEAMQLLDIVNKVNAGTKFDIYNSLPKALKDIVNTIVASSRGMHKKNDVAKALINDFITGADIEKHLVDFQESLKKATDTPSITDMYSEYTRENMEIELIKKAEILEEEGKVEQATTLRNVSKAFTDSYTYDRLREFLKTNNRARNRITKSLKDYDKHCRDLNISNQPSKFKFNDVFMVAETLERVIGNEYSLDDIKKFVIIFCKYCSPIREKDIPGSTFMYYSIKNIIMLDYVEERTTEFSQLVISNIKKFIDEILQYEKDHNEMLKNTKKK